MRFVALAVVVASLACSNGRTALEEVLASVEFQEVASSSCHDQAAERLAKWQAEGFSPKDAWGNPFRLAVEPRPEGEGFSLEIVSFGSDARPGPCRCNKPGGDLVWRDGFFVRD